MRIKINLSRIFLVAMVVALAISLYFDLRRTDFEFNPNKSILHVTNVGEIEPSNYRIVFASPQSREASWDCGRYPGIDLKPDSTYRLHRGICVELYFDAHPTGLDQFWLKLDGLTQNRRQVDVPQIRFREGRAWVWEFL